MLGIGAAFLAIAVLFLALPFAAIRARPYLAYLAE